MIKDLTENVIATILAVALILLTMTYYSGALVRLISTTFSNLLQ